MSDTYTKLFRSITASTIVSEPLATRWLWVTMLSQADASGCVWGSVPGLARLANIDVSECEAALARFLSPDPYSRTQDHEGRRIEVIPRGWRLLNHALYANIRNAAEREEYRRQWDRENRGNRPSSKRRKPDPRQPPTTPDTPPTQSDKSDTTSTSTSTKEQEQKKKPRATRAAAALGYVPADWIDGPAWRAYIEMRIAKGAVPTLNTCGLVEKRLARLLEGVPLGDLQRRAAEILDQSTRNTWTDVYAIKPEGKANGKTGGGARESVADRAARFADEGDAAERARLGRG